MDKDESLRRLKELLYQVKQCEQLSRELDQKKEQLRLLRSEPMTAVSSFDENHKREFIMSRAGKEPVKPKGVVKLVVPVYLSKKKTYEKEHAEYMSRYREAEKEYFSEYCEVRERLKSEEEADRACSIQSTEEALRKIETKSSEASAILQANELLSEKLKNAVIITVLIEYFQDQRADSIKEAVNLYFEEEHRKKLEVYAEEQVRLTAEAAEQARLAAESASEAAESANEAVRRVDEAMQRANAAYERADEAYSEAQSAYWAATSDNN